MGADAMILVFWMLNFKPTFSLSSFTFIKRLFSSSSLSALRVVSSAYLTLLMFLLAILIPACASSSPVFLMMYCAYELNKQGDNIQPWHTPFPIWNQSVVLCPVVLCSVLNVASWPHTGFSRGRSGGLVFPSPSEFSTVHCDPHSWQWLKCSLVKKKKKKQNQKPWARNTQPHHTWIPNLQKLRDKKCHWVLGYFVISQCVLQSLPFSHSQLFRTLKDCSPTDSPAHGDSPGPWGFSPPMGILQARTLEWVSTPSSRGSSPPRDRTRTSPALAGLFFTASTT